MQFCAFDLDPKSLVLREAGGERLSKVAARELLKQLRAGEVVELELDARVFRQSLTPRPLPAAKRREANANFVYFADLGALAESFAGRPFLRDHDRSLLATGGTILSSELAEDGDNWTAFVQKLSLKAPWAVEAALMGTLRTFSIGWQPKGNGMKAYRQSMYCTVCAGPWIGGECTHWPGDEVKLDGAGVHVIVELEWRNVIGRETSGVTFPAVPGTSIDGVRAALAELRQTSEAPMLLSKLIGILSLAAPATEENALAAIQGLQAKAGEADGLRAKVASMETQLAAAEESRNTAATELADAHARYSELLERNRKKDEDGLVSRALAEGKMRPDNKSVEAAIRALATPRPNEKGRVELAEVDRALAAATDYVDKMPRLDPIGMPPQNPPDVPRKSKHEHGLSEDELAMAKSLGLTPEQWRKHNPE